MITETELNALLKVVNEYDRKLKKAANIDDSYFEPGDMEFLDKYLGVYYPEEKRISLRCPVQGLRYDNRSVYLETVREGDELFIIREQENPVNPNNFLVNSQRKQNLGSLPKDLCNALAPLYDRGDTVLGSAKASYVEHLTERSRYALQGILFIEFDMHLK